MEIKRVGSQPSGKGPADWFTGTVRVDPLFSAPVPAHVVGASVTFEPGARTAWHTHPLGQTLIVTAGCGRAQRWGEEIRPVDVVWIPAGKKHWHGAAPTTAMSHFAIQEQLDGKDDRLDGKGERGTVPRLIKKIVRGPGSAPVTKQIGARGRAAQNSTLASTHDSWVLS